jgi:hypothetical protein
LAAVYVKQSASDLAGAKTAAWIAIALAVVVVAQTVWLRLGTQTKPYVVG